MHFIVCFLACVTNPIGDPSRFPYVEYVRSEELLKFFEFLWDSTVLRTGPTVSQTTLQRANEMYTNITNRFHETTKWCIDALGINQQVRMRMSSKYKIISSLNLNRVKQRHIH